MHNLKIRFDSIDLIDIKSLRIYNTILFFFEELNILNDEFEDYDFTWVNFTRVIKQATFATNSFLPEAGHKQADIGGG